MDFLKVIIIHKDNSIQNSHSLFFNLFWAKIKDSAMVDHSYKLIY